MLQLEVERNEFAESLFSKSVTTDQPLQQSSNLNTILPPVNMTAKTRSGRKFPLARKPKPAAAHIDPAKFRHRRRSPRNHSVSKIHDKKVEVILRAEKRKRQRKEEREENQENEPEAEEAVVEELPSDNSSRRRSNRNIHAIRLKGTASFYRNLRTLFFSKISENGYQHIGGNRVQWLRKHNDPPIYVIDDFLTHSELEYFDSRVKELKFERSFVDNMALEEMRGANDSADNGGSYSSKKRQRRAILDTTHRTSRFFGFKKQQDAKIASLERRIAGLLGCWVHQIEPLQLVRYLPGEFFNVHHDMGDLLDDDEVKLPKKHIMLKRRVLTLFFYLNTLSEDQGGCTYFPKCGNLRVQPKRGRVVIWSNVTADGLPDPRTIHAGEPVISDQQDFAKYGLNLWICEE